MTDHSHPPPRGDEHGPGPRRWAFWGFLLVAGFFLLAEHRAHVVEFLPYVLLLACPLMHLFHGHGGHGGHGRHGEPDRRDDSKRDGGQP